MNLSKLLPLGSCKQSFFGQKLVDWKKTLQELQMLSSVPINCQVTKIVKNPGSQMSQVSMIAPLGCYLMEVHR